MESETKGKPTPENHFWIPVDSYMASKDQRVVYFKVTENMIDSLIV